MAAVIVIYINHIQVNHPHTAALRIVEAVNHHVVHLMAEAASHQAVRQRVHPEAIAAAPEQAVIVKRQEQQRRVILQKANIIIILMMMDMTISIWMEIMITTDIIETAIMQMAWMMQWMSTEKTGNADKDLQKGDHYGRTLFYNSRM